MEEISSQLLFQADSAASAAWHRRPLGSVPTAARRRNLCTPWAMEAGQRLPAETGSPLRVIPHPPSDATTKSHSAPSSLIDRKSACVAPFLPVLIVAPSHSFPRHDRYRSLSRVHAVPGTLPLRVFAAGLPLPERDRGLGNLLRNARIVPSRRVHARLLPPFRATRTKKKNRRGRTPKGIQPRRLTRQRASRHCRAALHLVIRRTLDPRTRSSSLCSAL